METDRVLRRFFIDYTQKKAAAQAAERFGINKFFSEYQYRERVYRAAERKTDKLLSSRFNVFSLLAREADEVAISRIIADMLRFDGVHGQEEIFIKFFLEFLDQNPLASIYERNKSYLPIHQNNFRKFIIETEYPTSTGRRIDIFIKTDNDCLIAIENKLFAKDQPNQVQDYIAYLRQFNTTNYLLIYLTLDNHLPSANSICESSLESYINTGNIVILSHKNFILPWLKTCRNHCASIRYQFFLEDLISHLENLYYLQGGVYEYP